MTALIPVLLAVATALAPDVTLIRGKFTPGQQPDGNSVVFRARKGFVVIDTGRHAEHTQSIVDLAKSGKEPVVAIVNTHWHLDHVGGNVLLRHEFPGMRVYATGAIDEALQGFLARYRGQLLEMIEKTKDPAEQTTFRTEVALIDAGRALAPDEVVEKDGTRTIGGRKFDLHVEHGATAGDIWVYDKATRILVAGDLITLPVPFLDTADPAAWQTALDRIAKVDFRTVVPGHGAAMQRCELEMYRTAFSNLLSCGASAKSKDDCIAGWMSDAAELIRDDDPKFVRSMLGYYLDTKLRK